MKYEVILLKKTLKSLKKIPSREQEVFFNLVNDLIKNGPVQPKYMNYSKLGKGKYHCHLSYHWVACWTCEDGRYKVEVYYVGSRESAPY